ncbi:HAD family hydrolase [Flavivirga rizhaonensis]|uniref:HAD family hydrolase n=1 Tax=Flavivirga rizhaonensis TaxID=2559571 RepID=A0A4S1DUS4_9FLAO|nr:HAD family hydrolase [Flavivirga rizhaonensis]TGV01585.1 HAD family hydrolase [Flavivirga rizhaonensis]
MTTKTNKTVIFDLDDTLYNEIDFLKSAYKDISKEIANDVNTDAESIYNDMLAYYYKNENVFEVVIKKYCTCYSIQDLLRVYRNHQPKLELSKDRQDVLNSLKNKHINLGLLTDGRSVQQRNKIKALNLEEWFSEIIISEEYGSEKPDINNYKYFEKVYGKGSYYYVGDNIRKDFITPNKLDWTTICLADKGLNIHKQDKVFTLNEEYLAKYTVSKFADILSFID